MTKATHALTWQSDCTSGALNPVAFSIGQVWGKVNGGWVGRYSNGMGLVEQAQGMYRDRQTDKRNVILRVILTVVDPWGREWGQRPIHYPKIPWICFHPVHGNRVLSKRMWQVKTRPAWFKVVECWLLALRGPRHVLLDSNSASSSLPFIWDGRGKVTQHKYKYEPKRTAPPLISAEPWITSVINQEVKFHQWAP